MSEENRTVVGVVAMAGLGISLSAFLLGPWITFGLLTLPLLVQKR